MSEKRIEHDWEILEPDSSGGVEFIPIAYLPDEGSERRSICEIQPNGPDLQLCDEDHQRARLIVAAPDLLAACRAQHEALDTLLAMLVVRDRGFMPSQSPAWPAILQGRAAIKKVEATL